MLAATPFALLVVAALLRPARLPVLAVLVVGMFLAARLARPGRGRVAAAGPWAACLPIAVSLAWGLLVAPARAGGVDCTNPASPFALWRLGEAAVALGTLGIAGLAIGALDSTAGLRRPGGRLAALSVFAFLASGPLALLLGPWFARPFFGEFQLAVGTLGAIAPAVLFAASNGLMEELEYRGAALGWSEGALGRIGALVAQAVVFGAAHTGSDFVGSPLPVALAMAAAGVVAGLLVRRTGSLALPIAVHAGCDIPLYYYWACPLG
ncbi:MAG: CPBP family intramembrane glutamic endopeptidase [Candidatus Limnocylindrales bacterium]